MLTRKSNNTIVTSRVTSFRPVNHSHLLLFQLSRLHLTKQRKMFEEVASKDFLEFKFGSRGYLDQLTSAVAKTGRLNAVRCEIRTISSDKPNVPDQSVVWMTHDFGFMGGSLGCAEGEVLSRGFEHGLENKLPSSR